MTRTIKRGQVFFLVTAVFCLLLSGCGASYNFEKASKLEKQGFFAQAAQEYRDVSNKYPRTEYAPAALFFAARIYQNKLKAYDEAVKLYSELISRFGDNQYWVKLAKIGIFSSPDYFPLNDGNSWVEGDSDTFGRNMRAELSCTMISKIPQPDNSDKLSFQSGYAYSITKKIYAGERFVTEQKKYYLKEEYELREMSDLQSNQYTVLLAYPFEAGKSWMTVRDKRRIRLTIIADNVAVPTSAGQFSGCLKIKEEILDLPGSYKYIYYAPGVGPVLVTAGTSNLEHRSSELISYKFKE